MLFTRELMQRCTRHFICTHLHHLPLPVFPMTGYCRTATRRLPLSERREAFHLVTRLFPVTYYNTGSIIFMSGKVLNRLRVNTGIQQVGDIGMPLRYNKDKSENPLLPRLLRCCKRAYDTKYRNKNVYATIYCCFLKTKKSMSNLNQRGFSDLPPFFFHYNTPFGGGRLGGDKEPFHIKDKRAATR